MFKNTSERYGWISIAVHWVVAVVVIGMFALGWWMVDLSYYDPWYKTGPDIHRSIGILLLLTMLFRLVWRWLNPSPQPLDQNAVLQNRLAHGAHLLLYMIIFVVLVTGYLISTAEGDPISVFNWFDVPATLQGGKEQADRAGDIHLYLAVALLVLAFLHAAAALQHHFIKRDRTLKRMLKP